VESGVEWKNKGKPHNHTHTHSPIYLMKVSGAAAVVVERRKRDFHAISKVPSSAETYYLLPSSLSLSISTP